MALVPCQRCQGTGTIVKKVGPGKWQEIDCPAKCKDGKVEERTR